MKIISEIGTDMQAFPSEHHLASWAGMCPGNNESGGKKKALIAIGHMILCACYHIILKKEPFNELGMDFLEEKLKEKRIEHYAKKLKELGYKIDKIA